MGSSPVTATTPSLGEVTLERFLLDVTGWQRGQPLVVAFSGGPDSTALLAATVRVAGGSRVYAAHFDHRLDSDSSRRASDAENIARRLGALWVCGTVTKPRRMRRGTEAWARSQRYGFLERTRRWLGAPAVLTAHHRQDQVETVLLRLLFGSGLRGLEAIRPWIAGVGRPWLDLPRAVVRTEALRTGLTSITDPTNADLAVPRNRIRHLLLPCLTSQDARLEQLLADVADAAGVARRALQRRLCEQLDLDRGVDGFPSLDLGALARLPAPLWPAAVSLLESPASLADQAPPASSRSEIQELQRQVRAGGRVGVSLARDQRWVGANARLTMKPKPIEAGPFSQRLDLPGGVDLPDGGRVSISGATPQEWMLTGDPRRAALELPQRVALGVRNRRPGDRIRPLGSAYRRKLKDVLIDVKVPREERDRLPLLTVDDNPVWVPGVTIDHGFRVRGRSPLWVAQWHPGRRN